MNITTKNWRSEIRWHARARAKGCVKERIKVLTSITESLLDGLSYTVISQMVG